MQLNGHRPEDESLQRARREAEALAETLDRMWQAVAMLSRSGKVVYANRAATRLLRDSSGLSLSHDGRLVAGSGEARAAMARALAQCAGSLPVAVLRSARPPLVLDLQPLPQGLEGTFGAVALVFINDPDARPGDRTAALQSAFGLTGAEARLVQSLSEGRTLKKIASLHQITYESARTYVRRALSKTGASRQAELVRIAHALR